jgi:hypothetical protein
VDLIMANGAEVGAIGLAFQDLASSANSSFRVIASSSDSSPRSRTPCEQ